MNTTILTGGRAFGKTWQRDQWLKDQPLNSKIKMIYAHTHYAAPAVKPEPAKPGIPVELFLKQHGVKTREIHGKLYAFDAWTINGIPGGEWVNATAWTLQDARDFLGY